jgi:hypothetical protein
LSYVGRFGAARGTRRGFVTRVTLWVLKGSCARATGLNGRFLRAAGA